MRTQIDVGIFGFCGRTDVETHLLLDVDGDVNAERRARYLVDARALGPGWLCPTAFLTKCVTALYDWSP